MTSVHVFAHISELSDVKLHDNSSLDDIFHTFHKRIEYTCSDFSCRSKWNRSDSKHKCTVKCLSCFPLLKLNSRKWIMKSNHKNKFFLFLGGLRQCRISLVSTSCNWYLLRTYTSKVLFLKKLMTLTNLHITHEIWIWVFGINRLCWTNMSSVSIGICILSLYK